MTLGQMNDSGVIKARRFGLMVPVIALVAGLMVAVFAVAWLAAEAQDRQAVNATRHTVLSVVEGNRRELGGWASDYSYWDAFVEKVVIEPDPVWIDDNIGVYAQENLEVDVTLVVDGANEPYVVSIAEGTSVEESLLDLPAGLVELAQAARQSAGPVERRPEAQQTYIRFGDTVFMAAAAVAKWEDDDALPVRAGGPVVLIYMRRIDEELLSAFSSSYMIDGLKLAAAGAEAPDGLALRGMDGEVVAHLIWNNARPGTEFLKDLTVPMIVILLIAGASIAWIVVRIRIAVGQMMSAHEILNQRTDALRRARDEADRANRAKTEFLAQMSHDLRTPLNAILGFSEVIALQTFGSDAAAGERYRDYARQIHAGGDHLRSLIDSILDVARLDSGRYELHAVPVALDAAVGTCLSLLNDTLEAKALTVKAPPTGLTVTVDHSALEQILLNLVGNAAKYTEPGGTITIEGERTPDGVTVAIGDTGLGMSETDVASAFELFTRGTSGFGTYAEGTGLGLSIVKRLIDLHGGTVEIDSALGKGTTVTVVLPDQPLQDQPLPTVMSAPGLMSDD